MKACQWLHQQQGKEIDSYGIVTNGEGWKFYRLSVNGEVSETLLTGVGDMPMLLGRLRVFFELCEQNLN